MHGRGNMSPVASNTPNGSGGVSPAHIARDETHGHVRLRHDQSPPGASRRPEPAPLAASSGSTRQVSDVLPSTSESKGTTIIKGLSTNELDGTRRSAGLERRVELTFEKRQSLSGWDRSAGYITRRIQLQRKRAFVPGTVQDRVRTRSSRPRPPRPPAQMPAQSALASGAPGPAHLATHHCANGHGRASEPHPHRALANLHGTQLRSAATVLLVTADTVAVGLDGNESVPDPGGQLDGLWPKTGHDHRDRLAGHLIDPCSVDGVVLSPVQFSELALTRCFFELSSWVSTRLGVAQLCSLRASPLLPETERPGELGLVAAACAITVG